MPRRAMSSVLRPSMRSPRKRIWPSVFTMPHKARKVVVLPAPFAPSKAVIDFSSIAKPIPWITRVAP